jgi:hypothetical protein
MKRLCLQFLALILPLFVCFSAAAAQQKQPELISFFQSSISYDIIKLNVDKTRIQMNLNAEGKVASVKLLKGNALLFVKIKDDLAKWIFDESSEPQRSIVLEVGDDDSNRNIYSRKKTIISPYRIEIKILAPILSFVPYDWEEGTSSCEIHQEVLIKDKVPIAYGLMSFSYDRAAYETEKPKLFPHANGYYLGGCVVDWNSSPEYAEVLYCRKCRDAEKAWLAENVKKEQN